jgi:hypothetical protein
MRYDPSRPPSPLNLKPAHLYLREEKARLVREHGKCTKDFLRSDGAILLEFADGFTTQLSMPRNAVNPNRNGDWR